MDSKNDKKKDEISRKFKDLILYSLSIFKASAITVSIFKTAISAYYNFQKDKHKFIKDAGPFFFKYREHIINENMYFFITHDYEDQMEDWNIITKGYGKSISEKFRDVIRNEGKKLYEVNPKQGLSSIKALLKLYCEFLMLETEK